jgi:hypothetical protein
MAHARRAFQLAGDIGSDDLVGAALSALCMAEAMSGQLDRSIELGNRALDAWVPGTRGADFAELHQVLADQ